LKRRIKRRLLALVCLLGSTAFFGLAAPGASAQNVCVHLTVSVDPVGTILDNAGTCLPGGGGTLPPLPVLL
jgi:hypothetical protein